MDINEVRLHNMMLLVKEAGSQAKFAESVGVNPGEISHIKNPNHDRNIGSSLARKFERVYKKPFGWMDSTLKSDFVQTPMQSAVRVNRIEAWDSNTPLHDDEVEVPFFMDVELAAGAGSDLNSEINGPRLRFSKSTLRRCNVEPENAVCVKVNGSSMEPRLFDGDVVGVDLGDKRIVDGKIYAINHDGLLRIKRLYLLGGGGLRINSLNEEEYPTEILDAEQRQAITVVGRIFWHSSIWK